MTENKNPTIATVCSHTSLQIFDGARKEGFKTLGICLGKPPGFYDAFPRAKPDEFFSVSSYQEIIEKTPELIEKDVMHASKSRVSGTNWCSNGNPTVQRSVSGSQAPAFLCRLSIRRQMTPGVP
jgi:hypothetical protein